MRLIVKILPGVALCLILGIAAAPASATTIFAMNPGDLPATAQDLTSQFPTEIQGSVADNSDQFLSVNVFEINILDYLHFSAFTSAVDFGIPDTELFLFDSSGLGVYMNDDIDGGNTLSCLPSALNNPCSTPLPPGVGPTANGVYYLAVAVSQNLPTSAPGPSGEIFTLGSSTDVVGPDLSNGGGAPVTSWDDGLFAPSDPDLVNYDIFLTGTVPEPATSALVGLAGVVLVLLRRKLQKVQ
jgi:hypothetical protein